MKKIIGLTIVLALLSTSAFAATVITASTADASIVKATAPATVEIGKCSKGVRIGITYTATAYALMTVHKSGSKYYGTAYDSTAIYVKTPAGDINAAFAVPAYSTTTGTFDQTGWAAL